MQSRASAVRKDAVGIMATDRQLIQVVNGLCGRDYDAIAAYESAIDRLHDAADREQLRMFLADHVRHTRMLSAAVHKLEGPAATRGTLLGNLQRAKVILASALDDHTIFMALRSNESAMTSAYEKAARHDAIDVALRDVLETHLADERRHRAWIDARTESFARLPHHA
jgi:uncharacterized protein (TIGR02284 family)